MLMRCRCDAYIDAISPRQRRPESHCTMPSDDPEHQSCFCQSAIPSLNANVLWRFSNETLVSSRPFRSRLVLAHALRQLSRHFPTRSQPAVHRQQSGAGQSVALVSTPSPLRVLQSADWGNRMHVYRGLCRRTRFRIPDIWWSLFLHITSCAT